MQAHAGVAEERLAFAAVTLPTARDDILPNGGSSARFGDDVVHCLCRLAAVLACGAVAEEDCAAREAVWVARGRGGGVVGEEDCVGGAEREGCCAEGV